MIESGICQWLCPNFDFVLTLASNWTRFNNEQTHNIGATGMVLINRKLPKGKGMTCLQNWNKITAALMGLYPVGNAIHDWLGEMTPPWETLANAFYSVQCFLKSQQKRCPDECDEKLFTLWKAWQDTFPGQSFNKFHALFCAIRSFIHTYHIAGRATRRGTLPRIAQV